MIKQLEQKIEFQAKAFATMIRNGDEDTGAGCERWGKLVGLCIAYRIATGDDSRAHVSLANEFLEKAQLSLGHIDAEGYAI